MSKQTLPILLTATSRQTWGEGGTVTYADGYRIHTFLNTSQFRLLVGGELEYAVVAGGGGGGGTSSDSPGGGGAGGVEWTKRYFVPGVYDVTVGSGGAGGVGANRGLNGANSVFGDITVTGGGGGGCSEGGVASVGRQGGSGGGGGFDGTVGPAGGSRIPGQGQNGGAAGNVVSGSRGGGGGGGFGRRGQVGSTSKGGNGGNGLAIALSGSLEHVSGGGGGGTFSGTGTGGVGGWGGGASAPNPSSNGNDGTANTGGGGSAASRGSGGGTRNGGAGGSGKIVIRYKIQSGRPPVAQTGRSVLAAIYTNKNYQPDFAGGGFSISPDGDRLFQCANTGIVYQYNLSIKRDISTASYTTKSHDTSAQTTGAGSHGCVLSADGTKMYAWRSLNASYQTVYQYTLSTPWDISTASYDSKSWNHAQGAFANVFFKPDGTKAYVATYSSKTVYQYTLSTPWDISTASYDSKSAAGGSWIADIASAKITPDGKQLLMLSYTGAALHRLALTTPWDVSTAAYRYDQKAYTSFGSVLLGIDFDNVGSRLYLYSNTNTRFYQFDIQGRDHGDFDNITLKHTWSSGYSNTYSLSFAPDGLSFITSEDISTGFGRYRTLTKPWDLSSITGTVVSWGSGAGPIGWFWHPSGDGFYGHSFDNRNFRMMTVSTAFQIVSAAFEGIYPTTPSNTRDVFLSEDGSKIYTIQTASPSVVYQYALTTPWSLPGTLPTATTKTLTGINNCRTLAFSPNGRYLYVINNNTSLTQFYLSTPWDISTANPTGKTWAIEFPGTGNNFGLRFSPDMTKMYYVHGGGTFYQYDLT